MIDSMMQLQIPDLPPPDPLESNERYTPPYVWRPALQAWGLDRFSLDPCSNSKTDPNIPADYHYTIEDNGLDNFWWGHVFVNPPFSRGDIDRWVRRFCHAWNSGEIDGGVVVVPARVNSTWAQHLMDNVNAICFPSGRINYLHPITRRPILGANFDSMIGLVGESPYLFYDTYRELGRVVYTGVIPRVLYDEERGVWR